ncbi:hypothetical protein QBC42DRAFT_76334 [Cladorrhinum samala]|uniref:Uncharacterized protein n=1 Tax=Cladorrhinum samala TaxID=585594 RepID=A0AAV9HQ09_9PEZI|nr:hypothetical protein QBC42DRAFT_76334 [Cladorrhinum samala]
MNIDHTHIYTDTTTHNTPLGRADVHIYITLPLERVTIIFFSFFVSVCKLLSSPSLILGLVSPIGLILVIDC